jgi:hypothetical protein
MTDPSIPQDPIPYATPQPLRQSRAGVASFVLGVISVITLFLSLTLRGKTPGGPPPAIHRATAILIFTVFVSVPLIGALCGVVGVLSRDRKHPLAVAGLVLNGIVLSLLALGIAYALSQR